MGKNSHPEINDHHIVPSSRGGRNEQSNIKRTPAKYHVYYHALFANLTPAEIYDYLSDVWFNPRKSFIKPEDWLKRQD